MRVIKTIRNIFAIEELRTRILNTIGFIIIFRVGAFILLPGLDYAEVNAANDAASSGGANSLQDFLDTFLGGAFGNKAIFGLGIMPYISASIVIQLLTVAVPYFQRLQKEGESGRNKINQITRILTIIICAIQSIGFQATIKPEWIMDDMLVGNSTVLFTITSTIVLTSGTVFCMWLGEKITEKGIGNGISLLIMIGIISRFPYAFLDEMASKGLEGLLFSVIEILVFFFIVMGVVLITQATRRIPVNYAKQVVGKQVVGGQRQFIPLKVNAAGVMPIIFAQSLMFIPGLISKQWAESSKFWASVSSAFGDPFSWQYNLMFALMIVIFTFFYTAITINPNQMADDLKRNGGFIPGIKPGPPTADFIDNVLSKITFPGALFIAVIAIVPSIAGAFGVSKGFAYFFGGTSLLIMVGVVIDTLQQIESYLLMRKYEGMMKNGKLKGRSQNVAPVSGV